MMIIVDCTTVKSDYEPRSARAHAHGKSSSSPKIPRKVNVQIISPIGSRWSIPCFGAPDMWGGHTCSRGLTQRSAWWLQRTINYLTPDSVGIEGLNFAKYTLNFQAFLVIYYFCWRSSIMATAYASKYDVDLAQMPLCDESLISGRFWMWIVMI